MNVKLSLGIILFVVGLILAVVGIAGVGSDNDDASAVITQGQVNTQQESTLGGMAIPIVAGLSLAAGGLLMGLSLGNWKNPRTTLEPGDEKVNPEGYQKMKHV